MAGGRRGGKGDETFTFRKGRYRKRSPPWCHQLLYSSVSSDSMRALAVSAVHGLSFISALLERHEQTSHEVAPSTATVLSARSAAKVSTTLAARAGVHAIRLLYASAAATRTQTAVPATPELGHERTVDAAGEGAAGTTVRVAGVPTSTEGPEARYHVCTR